MADCRPAVAGANVQLDQKLVGHSTPFPKGWQLDIDRAAVRIVRMNRRCFDRMGYLGPTLCGDYHRCTPAHAPAMLVPGEDEHNVVRFGFEATDDSAGAGPCDHFVGKIPGYNILKGGRQRPGRHAVRALEVDSVPIHRAPGAAVPGGCPGQIDGIACRAGGGALGGCGGCGGGAGGGGGGGGGGTPGGGGLGIGGGDGGGGGGGGSGGAGPLGG
eukprot:244952-Prymnesium_polylepis.3